jgi:aspartokinase-like uncharacterized kinase
MLHKISQFCDKIDGIKKDADRLREIKYNNPKTNHRDHMIQGLIEQIQSDCYIVSQDKQDYNKTED